MTTVLGVGGMLHDPSAAVIAGGRLVAAMESEKVTRHHREISLLPVEAIDAVLGQAGAALSDVDWIATNWDARARSNWLYAPTIARFLAAGLNPIPHLSILIGLAGAYHERAFRLQMRRGAIPRVRPVSHHLAHVGVSYTLSPYEEAAVAIIDGAAETAATSLFHARGRRVKRLRTWSLPFDSFGTVFAMATEHLGFRMLGDEYKVMALAAFGRPNPAFDRFFEAMVRIDTDGGYAVSRQMLGAFLRNGYQFPQKTWEGVLAPRKAGDPLDQRHFDFARALQTRVGDAVVAMLRKLRADTGCPTLCLGGGVAMNSVINGRIAAECGFGAVHIPPCAHDGGTSAGAAAWLMHHVDGGERPAPIDHAYLGSAYSDDQIEAALERSGGRYRRVPDPARAAAEMIAAGWIVGWFQGAAEFGPRALGARSILADARDPAMRARVSELVKEREEFRPLAPAVLAERYAAFFPGLAQSPYMTFVGRASRLARESIPAAIHADGTARPQYVDRERCPLFHALITHVHRLTGAPAVINTSFNLSGEPIVRTPTDALRTFYASRLDCLVIGSFMVVKSAAHERADDDAPAIAEVA